MYEEKRCTEMVSSEWQVGSRVGPLRGCSALFIPL
jgi:hypothetical protein